MPTFTFLSNGDDDYQVVDETGEIVFARQGDDVIIGGSGDDIIFGGSGEDIIFGGAGDDIIFGGSDVDTLDGGSGSDLVFGNGDSDIFNYNVAENIGSTDLYIGGGGADSLVIDLAGSGLTGEDAQLILDFFNANSASGSVDFSLLTGLSVVGFELNLFAASIQNITLENASPILTLPSALTLAEDVPIGTLVAQASTIDPDGDTNFTYTLSGDNGDFTIDVNTGAISVLDTLSFEDIANYSLSVQVSDLNGNTDQETIAITIEDVNEAPVANVDVITVDEDGFVDFDVLANDSDPDGDTISLVSFEQPSNGVLTENLDGTFRYQPNTNYNGTDTFTYTISDGVLTDTATVVITVNPIEDAPVVVDDYVLVDEDGTIDIDVLANDSDPDGDVLTIESFVPGVGTVTQNQDGTFNYTPDADFSGLDNFKYTVTDGTNSVNGFVFITVSAINDAPEAVDDVAQVLEDGSVVIDALLNDNDVDGDVLTLESFTTTSNGTLISNGDGTFTYTPNANYNGSDSFNYTISDGTLTDTATVTINVTPVNDAPVAANPSLVLDEDTRSVGLSIGELNAFPILGSDVDGDSLTVTYGTPANGFLSTELIDGGGFPVFRTFYRPDPDFNGTDSVTYTLSDGQETAQGTITFTINPIDDAPVAADQSFDFNEDQTGVIGTVQATDADIALNGDVLTYSIISGNDDNAFDIDASTGEITALSPFDFDLTQQRVLNVQVQDSSLLTVTALITINIIEVPQIPLFTDGDDTVDFNDPFVQAGEFELGTQYDAGNGDDIVILADSGTPLSIYDPSITFNAGGGRDIIVGGRQDGTTINVNLGDGVDEFHPNFGTTLLDGGAGVDTIIFDTGNDALEDVFANAGVVFDLGDSGVQLVQSAPTAEEAYVQILNNSIENAFGTLNNDMLYGNNADNILAGRDGDDLLVGNDGNDLLVPGAGVDRVQAGRGSDTILISQLEPSSQGAEAIDGEGPNITADPGDFDTLNLVNIQGTGLTINNSAGTIKETGPGGTQIIFSGIESIVGTNQDDTYFASMTANDVFTAQDGVDSLLLGIGDYSNNTDFAMIFEIAGGLAGGATGTVVEIISDNDFDGAPGTINQSTFNSLQASGRAMYLSGVRVDLGNNTEQDTIHGGIDAYDGIENITGTNGNDLIFAKGTLADPNDTSQDPALLPPEDNTYNGFSGYDILSYNNVTTGGVTLLLNQSSTPFDTINDGVDIVVNFEGVIGSVLDDTLTTRIDGGVLIGSEGNDTLTSETITGATLFGGAGNDTLISSSFTSASNQGDILRGGIGEDIFIDNEVDDNDVIDGGADFDVIDYSGSTTAITTFSFQDVFNGIAQDLGAYGTDTITLVDGIIGSVHDDIIAASDIASHAIDGNDGSDTIDYSGLQIDPGQFGAVVDLSFSGFQNSIPFGVNGPIGQIIENVENVIGTANVDAIVASDADNIIDGGAGNDFVSYANASSGVYIDTTQSSAYNTFGSGNDHLISIERVIGSEFGDVIVGSDQGFAASAQGLTGNDYFIGSTGADLLRLSGDILDYASPSVLNSGGAQNTGIQLVNVTTLDTVTFLQNGGAFLIESDGTFADTAENNGSSRLFINTSYDITQTGNFTVSQNGTDVVATWQQAGDFERLIEPDANGEVVIEGRAEVPKSLRDAGDLFIGSLFGLDDNGLEQNDEVSVRFVNTGQTSDVAFGTISDSDKYDYTASGVDRTDVDIYKLKYENRDIWIIQNKVTGERDYTVDIEQFIFTNAIFDITLSGGLTNLFTENDDVIDLSLVDPTIFDPSRINQVVYQALGGNDIVTLATQSATLPDDPGVFFFAGAGDDVVLGRDRVDSINGGTGNDTITGGQSSGDKLFGGTGGDTLLIEGSLTLADLRLSESRVVFKDGSEAGAIRVDLSDGSSWIANNFESLSLESTSGEWNLRYNINQNPDYTASSIGFIAQSGTVNVSGTASKDIFIATNGSETFEGLQGDDVFFFSGSNNYFSGGSDTDTVIVNNLDAIINAGRLYSDGTAGIYNDLSASLRGTSDNNIAGSVTLGGSAQLAVADDVELVQFGDTVYLLDGLDRFARTPGNADDESETLIIETGTNSNDLIIGEIAGGAFSFSLADADLDYRIRGDDGDDILIGELAVGGDGGFQDYTSEFEGDGDSVFNDSGIETSVSIQFNADGGGDADADRFVGSDDEKNSNTTYTLNGGEGNDILVGPDLIRIADPQGGGLANAVLRGGIGDDTLVTGTDLTVDTFGLQGMKTTTTLIGGDGIDSFEISQDAGVVIIEDFDFVGVNNVGNNVEKIDLTALDLTLQSTNVDIRQVFNDTVVTFEENIGNLAIPVDVMLVFKDTDESTIIATQDFIF